MSKRDVVFPPARQDLYERNRYSPAVRANGLLFVSGQVGSREDGSVEPGLEAQVQRAFENLNAKTEYRVIASIINQDGTLAGNVAELRFKTLRDLDVFEEHPSWKIEYKIVGFRNING